MMQSKGASLGRDIVTFLNRNLVCALVATFVAAIFHSSVAIAQETADSGAIGPRSSLETIVVQTKQASAQDIQTMSTAVTGFSGIKLEREFAVTLEDLRDILLLRYLQNDKEFSEYLKRVNDELCSISEALGLASQQGEQFHRVSTNFSNTVSNPQNLAFIIKTPLF